MKLSNKPLAMAYVPWQPFENVMDGNCGLAQGSIFEDLIFPFIGAQAACQADSNNCHRNSGNYPKDSSNCSECQGNFGGNSQNSRQMSANNRQGNYPGNYSRGNNMPRSQQSQNYSNGRRCGY